MRHQDQQPRCYITVPMRAKTKEQPKQSPDYVAYSITSPYLTEYFKHCLERKKPIAIDLAIYENRDNSNQTVIAISMPHFEKARPTTLEDFFT